MKVLLDNCVHIKLKTLVQNHEVVHARDLGWRELGNGALLAEAAAAGFAAMITVDKKIRYEHNLNLLPVGILELMLCETDWRTSIRCCRALAPRSSNWLSSSS